jgi:hypothetical protein
MKPLMILVLFFASEAGAQSLADVARAERLRQQAVQSSVEVEKVGDHREAVFEEKNKSEPPDAVAETKKEPTREEKLRDERLSIMKTRSELLVRMGELKHDPDAVKAIEAQLIEVSKRAEAAKLEHLKKDQPAQ